MLKQSTKTRCEKRRIRKAAVPCKFYSRIQSVYASALQDDDNIVDIKCNYPLEGCELGQYTSDFLCKKADGSYMVRECIERRHLLKPLTVKLLDVSREFWFQKGIHDWGIVIDKEVVNEES
jgi:hypothetical protein